MRSRSLRDRLETATFHSVKTRPSALRYSSDSSRGSGKIRSVRAPLASTLKAKIPCDSRTSDPSFSHATSPFLNAAIHWALTFSSTAKVRCNRENALSERALMCSCWSDRRKVISASSATKPTRVFDSEWNPLSVIALASLPRRKLFISSLASGGSAWAKSLLNTRSR